MAIDYVRNVAFSSLAKNLGEDPWHFQGSPSDHDGVRVAFFYPAAGLYGGENVSIANDRYLRALTDFADQFPIGESRMTRRLFRRWKPKATQ